jgi:preprotein translocase subunit SecF
MENNINNSVPEAKSHKWWILLVLILVVGVIIFIYKKEFFLKKDNLNVTKLNSTLLQVPSELIMKENGQEVQFEKIENAEVFKLRSNEMLPEESIVYYVNKEQKQVQQDFFNQILKNKWVFTDGTKNIEGGIIFKFTDGNKYYFVKLTGGNEKQADTKYTTKVSVIIVNSK